MKKLFYFTTLFSSAIFLGHFPLSAGMTTSPNVPSTRGTDSYTTPSRSAEMKNERRTDKSSQTDAKAEMAAWMLESARAANDYVDDIDRGKYDQSWEKGDEIFQRVMSKNEWSKVLGMSRQKLGQARSRQVNLHQPAWDPRGLPKGPYMVIEYNTAFENAPQAKELLTLRRGNDGVWRVLTYEVKKR